MKRTVLALAAAAVAASFASPARAEGINLSWNDCGTSGVETLTFACNTNTGTPFTAVASFVAPPNINEFLGLNSQIDVFTDQAVLPEWWKHGSGTCRGTTGLAVSFDFTIGPFTCADFFGGQAAGGFLYESGFGSPNRARFRITCAVPFDNRGPVDDVSEYYAYKANILRAKTSGTGSCTGCTQPMCIVLNDIQLYQPPEALNDPLLFNPVDRNYVTWQGPVPGCPAATPVRAGTWGTVKGLYR